ncbi:hypothetical protein KP509_14G064100 [Ceratopteris richardii]|uniref:Uncharacterized protein n=1 Tax=Ceratopteris richardii TaxID=49495 RepID=A0A8T2TCI0_CERRI|nr:hypothetical protein KP509_14G064100 [Ceratopteris richardii]
MKPFFNELCPEPDHRGEHLFSSPLLAIQATVFADGGIAIGIANSHVVADGLSLWQFMVSWGQCTQGIPLSVPPLHDRRAVTVVNPSAEEASQWKLRRGIDEEGEIDSEQETDTEMEGKSDPATESSLHDPHHSDISSSQEQRLHDTKAQGDLVQYVFRMSASTIQKLKGEAGGSYTSLEVLRAHFWQRISVARRANADEWTYAIISVDHRPRINPPLAPSYFGNVLSSSIAVIKADKVRNRPLHFTVSRIHRQLAADKGKSINRFMHWLETHDSCVRLSSSFLKYKGVTVGNSQWFPVYEVDFGWGKPVAARVPKVGRDGVLLLLGGRPGSNQGDIEICTAFGSDVLERLLQDPAFEAEPPCPIPLA